LYEHVHVHVRKFLHVLTVVLAWALLMTAAPGDTREHPQAAAETQRRNGVRVRVKPVKVSPQESAAEATGLHASYRERNLCPVDKPRRWLPGDWRPRPYRRGVDGRGAPLRAHLGIDIFAPRGTPVRAPVEGRLERGQDRRGGRWFKVYGKTGYAFGSHMHAFAAPEGKVRAGEIIGYVGNTGNARYTSPHLHFEWHPHNGKARNPKKFLTVRCGGPTRSYVR